MFSYTAGSSTGVYVKTIVEGFLSFFASAGTSATMSLLSSQYMVSSSPRFLQASAATAGGASRAQRQAEADRAEISMKGSHALLLQ
jgi:hypothetical protein